MLIKDTSINKDRLGYISCLSHLSIRVRAIKIAIAHDIAESLAGDIAPSQGMSKKDKYQLELEAINRLVQTLESSAEGLKIKEYWEEYEDCQTSEAKFVKDLDKFEMIVQAHEYEIRHGLTLESFFSSTKGKFDHPEVKAWVEQLYSDRALESKMPKFLKSGKVVLVLQGRYAGRKAVIVKNYDEGTSARPYPHAIVAGVEKYPLKVTKAMSKKKIAKRSKVKPFIKVVNYNHIMPTRYNLDIDLKAVVSPETFKEGTQRFTAKKAIKTQFEERYNSGKNRWFFQKLRF
ncbi:hypothetical protein HK096_003849 [Nowakowskiella sp. JEL0078]|nr:hypothetical protein HK096_003849 [Nowakowskiella sp. JEL0078]